MKRIFIALVSLSVPLCACTADDKPVKKNAGEMFATCDSNRDGVISKDEYTNEKMEAFAKYDSNKDGSLSREEHEKMAVDLHDKLMN